MTHANMIAACRGAASRLALVLVLMLGACTHHRPADSPAMPPDAPRLAIVLDSILRAAYPADAPGATAIVIRDGETLYRGATGMADLELGVPMRPEMVFRIASMTKQFTGVAILMLVAEGRLSLADPLNRYLPDYPVDVSGVTLEHLIAHTSGIPNYTAIPEWYASVRSDLTAEQVVAYFRDRPLEFEPGTRWAYNNSGYILLGMIIEQVSGMTYADFVRTRILEPAGMAHSGFQLADAVVMHRAPGYSRTPSGWRNAEYVSNAHGQADGALLSSVDDLALWNAAIDRGDLLDAAGWRRAFTSFALNDGSDTRYTAGWMLGHLGSHATIEHGGDMPGFASHALRVPDQRLFVAVLANANPTASHPRPVAVEMAAHTLGVALRQPEIALDPTALDEYIGSYRHGVNDVRVIRRTGDRLTSRRAGGATFELHPVGDDTFAVGTEGRLRFLRDGGRVFAVEWLPRTGMAQRAPREDASSP